MSTPELRFQVSRVEPAGANIQVHWLFALSDGQRASIGAGITDLPCSLAELTQDGMIQAAIESAGGAAWCDMVRAIHEGDMRPIRELQMLDDWLAAFQFFRVKAGLQAISSEQAVQELKDGFAALRVGYKCSVFNITTGANWAHLFSFVLGESLYLVKVRDSEVVEWYELEPELVVDGESVRWASFDLQTGHPSEYYLVRTGEIEGTTVLEKYNLATRQLTGSTVQIDTGAIALPEDFEQELVTLGFEYRSTVFGYSTKSYGRVVEYVFTGNN
jgi:hypothetical protein